MELKDSKTFQNLATAFAGESQARVKYEYYACLLYTSPSPRD